MGIIKVRPRGPGSGHHSQRGSFKLLHNEPVPEEKLPLKVPGYDSDDCELAEVGCEYVTVGHQRCSFPYELYDLHDLKGILSLETWNSLLTEDERFSLAAFLPDMDQETFCLTIKELLTGDDMFFGSPLGKFYNQLKGGIYSPQVASLRQGLWILQRREYYYSLRSYHENLGQTFLEMKRAWEKCQSSNGVQERVQIWNCRKKQKPVFLVDLNAFPGEDLSKKEERNEDTLPLSNKTEYKNGCNDTEVHVNRLARSAARKAKGVLKLKPTASNLGQNQVMQPLPGKSGELSKHLPKGVLKIKSKDASLTQEKLRTKPEQISLDIWGGRAPIISTPQSGFKNNEHDFSETFPFLHQMDRDGSTYRNSDVLLDWQREELLHPGSFMDYERCQRQPKLTADVSQDTLWIKERFPLRPNQSLRNFSQEAVQIGECQNENKVLNTTKTQPSRSFFENSADPKIESFPLALENHQKRRLTAIISESDSRIPNKCIDKHEIQTNPSDHLQHETKHKINNVAMPGAEKSLMFPITYKRKKPYRKLNNADSLKQETAVDYNLDPAAASATVKPKPIAIKIKFRGCTDYSG